MRITKYLSFTKQKMYSSSMLKLDHQLLLHTITKTDFKPIFLTRKMLRIRVSAITPITYRYDKVIQYTNGNGSFLPIGL
jgi:hypothetical protein